MQRSSGLVARPGACLLLLLPWVALGCGRPVGTVTGKVTSAGIPLPGGTITYESEDGRVKLTAEIKPEDGTYTIPNVPIGDGKFSIDNSALAKAELASLGADVLKMTRGHMPDSVSVKAVSQGKYVPIDPRYRNPRTSGLTWTIRRGTNTDVDFDLK